MSAMAGAPQIADSQNDPSGSPAAVNGAARSDAARHLRPSAAPGIAADMAAAANGSAGGPRARSGEMLSADADDMAAAVNGSTGVRRPRSGRGAVLMERTLVLNVTFQPLSITTVRRALLLVLAGKADVVHAGDRVIRSERLCVPVPSVVRLTSHARVPYRRRAPLGRRAVFARDSYRCQYCGRRAECIDHVHPRSRGGEHTWENVVACCRSCNVSKGDSLLSEGRHRLRRAPFAPAPLAVAAAMRGDAPTEWTDYLGDLSPQPA